MGSCSMNGRRQATKKVGGARKGSFPRSGAGRVRMGALAQRCAVGLPLDPEPQGGDDPVDVVQDGLCVEADEMYTAGSKDAVAPSVVARSVTVDGVIDFDGERECRAVEVDNEASDDVLTVRATSKACFDGWPTSKEPTAPKVPSA